MSEAKVITFGCRLNSFESEIIRTNAEQAGLNDAFIFNTCAVTAEATRQARQSIRKHRRKFPDAKIIVTGCAAQIDPKTFSDMEEVTSVLGNEEKLKPESYPQLLTPEAFGEEKIRVNDIMSVKETAGHLVDGLESRSRAYVQVQNGCDHRCTFCIIPYGRGNSRSVPMGQVVQQIKNLLKKGYQEVVITGVDITSYGADLPGNPSLGNLIKEVLTHVPNLPRLRLSSIDSIEIDATLLDVILNEPRLMPHLHLSLQAGDNMILKRMKRRHSREDAIRFSETVLSHRPEMAFGADIIAGFPTETDDMFENSIKLVEDCHLTYLHVFPYSSRKGTPAARMPQVDKHIRKERAARLRDAGEQAVDKLYKGLVGLTQNVLIEKQISDTQSIGHSENFASVQLQHPSHSVSTGSIQTVRIDGLENGILNGTLK